MQETTSTIFSRLFNVADYHSGPAKRTDRGRRVQLEPSSGNTLLQLSPHSEACPESLLVKFFTYFTPVLVSFTLRLCVLKEIQQISCVGRRSKIKI